MPFLGSFRLNSFTVVKSSCSVLWFPVWLVVCGACPKLLFLAELIVCSMKGFTCILANWF